MNWLIYMFYQDSTKVEFCFIVFDVIILYIHVVVQSCNCNSSYKTYMCYLRMENKPYSCMLK